MVSCNAAFHLVYVPTALPACLGRSLETWLGEQSRNIAWKAVWQHGLERSLEIWLGTQSGNMAWSAVWKHGLERSLATWLAASLIVIQYFRCACKTPNCLPAYLILSYIHSDPDGLPSYADKCSFKSWSSDSYTKETWLAGAAEQQARSHNSPAHAAVHSWGFFQARWGLDCQGLGLCPPCS